MCSGYFWAAGLPELQEQGPTCRRAGKKVQKQVTRHQQLEAPDCQPGAGKGSAQSESEAVHDRSPHQSLPTSQPGRPDE